MPKIKPRRKKLTADQLRILGAPVEKGEIRLVEITPEMSMEEQALALADPQNWLVDPLAGHGFHYPLVLANLTHELSDSPTTSAVRTAIHEGLPKESFETLKTLTGISGDLLCTIVGIPARTLARRTVFKPDETGAILRVAAAFQRCLEVMEDLAISRKWFTEGKRALGGVSPAEFCDTEPGAAEVVNLLGRIEHGVFS